MKGIPTNSLSKSEPSIKQLFYRFWKVEEPVILSTPFPEEQKCEEIFSCSTTRNKSGNYAVLFPFRTDPSTLGDSRSVTLLRLYNLEHKLSNDPIILRHIKTSYRNT